MSIAARLYAKHRERILYLAVGGWNTVFGFGLFWLATILFPRVRYFGLLLAVNELSILNAYLGYRILVFRSRGPVFAELLRFHGIYLAATAVSIAVTSLLIELLGMHPVAANGIAIICTVIGGYLGHRYVSFRSPRSS